MEDAPAPTKVKKAKKETGAAKEKEESEAPTGCMAEPVEPPAAESDSQSCLGSLYTLLKGQEQMMAQTLASLAMNKQDSQTESQLLASCL